MATPAIFAKRIRELAKSIPLNNDRNIQRAAAAIISVVIPATPVDTGRARGNWQVSIGGDIKNQIERRDKTGAGAMAQARSTIGQWKGKSDIYIVNNVPYINRLNQGYSAQAPAGFVQQAVQVALTTIRKSRWLR